MHEPGAADGDRQVLSRHRHRAGPRGAADLARHPATARHVATKLARHFVADDPPPRAGGEARASASTTPAATSGRSPRRSSPRRNPGRRNARKLKRPSEWMIGDAARRRRRPATSAPIAGAEPARRAAVAAAGAQAALPTRTAPGSTACRIGSTSPTISRQRQCRSARPDGDARHGARPARLRGDAPRGRARREQAQALDAAADGARIPTEVIMPEHLPAIASPSCRDPPRAAARLRRAVRLGLCAAHRARRRPRSALPHHRAARRARRPCRGRAGRRSRLDQAARRQCLTARRRTRRRCRSTASSPSIRRCRTFTASTRPARRSSCMRSATPYRERSHFDGQDVLESGLARRGARRERLAQPRARRAGARRPRRPGEPRRLLRSGRSRRWSCAARRRCCHGCRRGGRR